MNSGNANACTGEPGLAVARAMQQACAGRIGRGRAQVAVGSTGIIGVQLDAAFMADGSEEGCRGGTRRTAVPDFNRSIMTTDRFPKICAVEVETVDGSRPAGSLRQGRRNDRSGHGHDALRGHHRRGA